LTGNTNDDAELMIVAASGLLSMLSKHANQRISMRARDDLYSADVR
jgi:hypothetical protein